MNEFIVVMYWPSDSDRGCEVYGPFETEDARYIWVTEVQAAADADDTLLKGVRILLTRMDEPFEVQR